MRNRVRAREREWVSEWEGREVAAILASIVRLLIPAYINYE